MPLRGFSGGHRQTLLSHILPRRDALPAPERRRFRVDAESEVVCLCHWQQERASRPALLLVHGLEGSSESQYIVGTANKAWDAGLNVVRMNVRNCGRSEALGPRLYHSGMSEDIGEVVRFLITEEKLERIALAGFSMGGNQVLKLAGEWGRDRMTPPEVIAVAAVSPAMDLAASATALHLPANRLYELRFLLSLRQSLRRKLRLFPQIEVPRWWWRSIVDFDDCVTAPHHGFRDAADYYERASASRVLEYIDVPTLIIHAADDPFVRVTPATRAKLAANSSIRFVECAHGGHCGFIAAARGYDGRWAEREVVAFAQQGAAARLRSRGVL